MLEALIAERAFLAGICAQALQVIGCDAGVQPLSVGRVRQRELARV